MTRVELMLRLAMANRALRVALGRRSGIAAARRAVIMATARLAAATPSAPPDLLRG